MCGNDCSDFVPIEHLPSPAARRRLGYHDDDQDYAVVYLGEPIHSGYVLIPRAHLANVTSLELVHHRPSEVALDRIPEPLGEIERLPDDGGLTRRADRAKSRAESRSAEERAAGLLDD